MKKFLFIFLFGMVFFSCEKAIPESESEDLELRSSPTEMDCRGCDAISISYTVNDTSECCVYTLNINTVDPCRAGRQQVYIDGVLSYVTASTNSWNITVCSSPVTVKVLGFNQVTQLYDDVCFEEEFQCSRCCKNVKADVTPLGADDDGCCVYDVRFSNPGICPLYVYNNLNQVVGTIAAGTNTIRTFKLCPSQYTGNLSVTYTVRTADGIVCKSFNLTFTCAVSCCTGVSYTITDLGSDSNGCCNYTVSITNNGFCDVNFVGPNGNIGTVNANDNNQFNVSLCPTSSNSGYNEIFKIIGSSGLVCDEFKLLYLCGVGGGNG